MLGKAPRGRPVWPALALLLVVRRSSSARSWPVARRPAT